VKSKELNESVVKTRTTKYMYIEKMCEKSKCVFIVGQGRFYLTNCAMFLFSGTDSPSLKMFRKFATDGVSKDRFVPRTILSQELFITKFLG
jgi:hypothetical protein